MPGIYKKVELVGTSPVSFAEAVKAAIEEASKTVRHMDWFEVVEQRGRVHDGKVAPPPPRLPSCRRRAGCAAFRRGTAGRSAPPRGGAGPA